MVKEESNIYTVNKKNEGQLDWLYVTYELPSTTRY